MANVEHRNGGATAVGSRMDQLIDEFKTRLDEALIQALASDYDLDRSYEDVRSQLSQLAETAQAEEATGFDPSGLGHLSDSDIGPFGGDDVTPESHLSTEFTSISESSDGFDTPCFTYQTELSEEEKIANLRMIFGNFPDHTLKFELKGAGGNLEKAFEALLTRQYLEENGELPKGVDGFYIADENSRPGKYTRKREHKPGREQLPVKYANPPRLDADGLVESLSATTIHATRIPQPHAREQRDAGKASQHPLTERPNASPSHLPLAVKASGAGPHGWQTVSTKKKTTKSGNTDIPPVPGATGSYYAETAAALRRKGPLYRQAAVLYEERDREEKRIRRGGSFADYEKIVAGQSDLYKTDLHGVPVLEGVKIAKHRVQGWWNRLSEGEREHRGAVTGITVITGVGHHSNVRGDSQLRRAVGAMLKNDGWKFETLTGQFHVTGRL
ncbi:hypothetical protein CONLIGDRAFT_636300 [Coniochaeta ligniaria NRRL 30616]|uniref:Smr domain-containing protein n=1 Tax=Coniochaeta ligniaria NRRL 30616 TaxID=1408157 RepID=A0A1J7J7R9_9PEZI|nr:hypothetical protein CONLIGDRAFT_636300 [Coniochaeta ligniaria NRRL 30616]